MYLKTKLVIQREGFPRHLEFQAHHFSNLDYFVENSSMWWRGILPGLI